MPPPPGVIPASVTWGGPGPAVWEQGTQIEPTPGDLCLGRKGYGVRWFESLPSASHLTLWLGAQVGLRPPPQSARNARCPWSLPNASAHHHAPVGLLRTWAWSQRTPRPGGRRIPVGLGRGPACAWSGFTAASPAWVYVCIRCGGGDLGAESWAPGSPSQPRKKHVSHTDTGIPSFLFLIREDCHLRGSQLQKAPIVS